RRLGNRVLTWEPGQIGEDQLPPRLEPRFDQGNHSLRIEVQPTLSATDDIEGLWGEVSLFCGTSDKADIEVTLGSELLGSDNLCFCDVNASDLGSLFGKGTC